jgi:L-ribulose-5-phosphate 4-epimerase
MEINQAKDTVIRAGRELAVKGLIARTWGNVSRRIDDETMVITPSGKDYFSITRDDIVKVNINTLEYEGNIKPSSEKGIHAACYKNKDVNFVIHTHQEYASVISACRINNFDADEAYNLLNGQVLCAPYGLPSTKGLCENITNVLLQTRGRALIMKNHGALCLGRDYEEAFETAAQLEAACIAYLEKKFCTCMQTRDYSDESLTKCVLKNYGIDAEKLKPKKLSFVLTENMVINDCPEAIAISTAKNIVLKPLIDDFAQIVGTEMRVAENNQNDVEKALRKADAVFVKGCGAVCTGSDAEAVSMIVEKNSKAYLWAKLHGSVIPINALESKLMRTIYKLKYSKQMDK